MEARPSFVAQVRGLPSNFWYANFMEVLERLAYFGVRAVAPLYLVAASSDNGLNLSFDDKGSIYGVWALLQCIIPMVSGAYTERYGYRKSLAVAFVINICGYLGMALSRPIADQLTARGWESAGFWVFMLAACLVGTGTAIFKPPCHGTVAKTTTEETSSLGWGVFYWVVNIGGALGPMCAAELRGEIDWHIVFYAAAVVTAANFLPAFLLYKEPLRGGSEAGAELEQQSPVGVFVHSIATVFKDPQLVVFLLIFSFFWLMFMQLWDLVPNFIEQWVDTSDVAPIFGSVNSDWVLSNGQTKPEMVINLDAIAIVALVIPISWLVGRIHKLAAMVIGMIVAVIGLIGCGATTIGWLCCLMVFVFALGEMACSPTFSAYVALIAPPDKKALYMGYSNIPFAIGWAAGAKIGGRLYEQLANKFLLARHYLVDQLGMSADLVFDERKLPTERVMETMARALETSGAAVQERIEFALRSLDWTATPQTQLHDEVVTTLGLALDLGNGISTASATQVLWDQYHPQAIWYWLGAIGMVGTIGMILFYLFTRTAQSASGGVPSTGSDTAE